MGWMFAHRERGTRTEGYLAQDLGEGIAIVASACHLSAAYLAVQTDRGVAGVVVLTRWVRDHDHNFGTKWSDETCGPYQVDCPARLLDLLSPVEDLYPNLSFGQEAAAEWRERCRETLQRRAHAATVKPGDTLSFTRPLRFHGGFSAQNFVFERQSTFHLVDMPELRVRITDWRVRDDWTLHRGEVA